MYTCIYTCSVSQAGHLKKWRRLLTVKHVYAVIVAYFFIELCLPRLTASNLLVLMVLASLMSLFDCLYKDASFQYTTQSFIAI